MKKILIILAIVVGFIALLILPGIAIKNSAISKEESIFEMRSDINVQIKNRNETLTLLIDSIKSYNTYEGEVITKITEAKNAINQGDFSNAQTIVTDLVKLYPELQSANNYAQYNNEVALWQNKIAASERTYNSTVKDYKSFVRKFPNSAYLNIGGYDVINFELLDYSVEAEKPLPSFN